MSKFNICSRSHHGTVLTFDLLTKNRTLLSKGNENGGMLTSKKKLSWPKGPSWASTFLPTKGIFSSSVFFTMQIYVVPWEKPVKTTMSDQRVNRATVLMGIKQRPVLDKVQKMTNLFRLLMNSAINNNIGVSMLVFLYVNLRRLVEEEPSSCPWKRDIRCCGPGLRWDVPPSALLASSCPLTSDLTNTCQE